MRQKIEAKLERLAEDAGAVLPLVTMALVVLIGMAAFATDLGWMYVNSSRVQRAAEASALSSVVELPADVAAATAVALDIADKNGYLPDLDTFVVVDPQPDGFDTRMRVEITDTIDLFFLSIFGMDTQTITRESTAEYLPPLPLGSPSSQFGNSCDPDQPGCSGQPNFWANIHGRDTNTRMGDAYSSRCSVSSGPSGNVNCDINPDYRPAGYLYGIEANGGSAFAVEFNDIEFRWDSPVQGTGDAIRTGDRGCEDWGVSGVPCGPNVRINLFGPDATPLDISDNPLICSTTVGVQPQILETDPYSFSSQGLCSIPNPVDGIYVLQIRVAAPGGGPDSGLNRYSLRATGGARLYAIGDMSLYNNASGTTTDFFLAEVDDIYRGKTFVVELYDPGDAPGGGTVQIKDPNGNTYPSCAMSTRPSGGSTWTSQGVQTPCEFFAQNSGSANYNGDWVKLEMDLSDTYTCAACWWKVNYVFAGGVNDTTTWRAYVVGAPVHVIPNGS